MKYLYYNPYETPTRIRLHSTLLNIDIEYTPEDSDDMPVWIDDLFKISKTNDYEDIQILLTAENDAYVKNSKKDSTGTAITGWISLKEYKKGGGYSNDKYCIEIINT